LVDSFYGIAGAAGIKATIATKQAGEAGFVAINQENEQAAHSDIPLTA
jgi:hypothetical protein